jgi:cardiolipin synthase
VNLTTYVYWQGEIAIEVAETLAAKAEEGVPVNVLLDWVGSLRMNTDLIDRMKASGVSVARFRPLRPYAIRRLNNRTHRKVLVVDGTAGMIGGVGIARSGRATRRTPTTGATPTSGSGARGPRAAGRLRRELARGHGRRARGRRLPAAPRRDPRRLAHAARALALRGGRHERRGPDVPGHRERPGDARPDLGLLRAAPGVHQRAVRGRQRGVTVRVLVPGTHMDKELVRLAGRRTYEELLSCGVHVFEYCPTMLHAKTLVIDGAWTSVGSVNFDNRSFQQNDEATLCVQSEAFARELTDQFMRDLEVSEEITRKRWDRRPMLHRGAELVAGLARREL